MKIYEKPMAIISKFEVADVIAASGASDEVVKSYLATDEAEAMGSTTQGVVFAW